MTMRPETSDRAGRAAFWSGLVVALAAAAATAHGLYEVAVAAGVPTGIAYTYPVMTDGLALVAYAATARLRAGARGYAWAVVVLAAGLSGLAQAMHLAGGLAGAGSALRFGVGAWPAVAAAIAAHLIHLLARPSTGTADATGDGTRSDAPEPQVVDADVSTASATVTGSDDGLVFSPASTAPDAGPVSVHLAGAAAVRVSDSDGVQPAGHPGVQSVELDGQEPLPFDSGPVHVTAPPASIAPPSGVRPAVGQPGGSGRPGERARAVARAHHAEHGDWPTVRELAEAAEVSTGTAGTALTDLRATADEPRERLHLVPSDREATTR